MATESPTTVSISVHPELAAVARCGEQQPEVEAARRVALREKIVEEGVTRPIYVWPNDGRLYVLEGMEIFAAANELGLQPVKDYAIVEIGLPDLASAKRWRFERAVTTQKDVPIWLRCFQALDLFKEQAAAYRELARENQRKGGKGLKVGDDDRKNSLKFLAEKAGVSSRTMARAKTLYDELHRDPNATDESKRQYVAADAIEAILQETEIGEKAIKNGAEDVKNERERVIRTNKNARGSKPPSADFVCDLDFDPSKPSQIIYGDSLELMERWSGMPAESRPQPSLIVGSPPYWIPVRTDAAAKDGKGAINYGDNFRAMMERRGIVNFDDYVEKFLRPYIMAAHALLPPGGRLILQVDNTRGRDEKDNLIVYWHTDAIRRIGQEVGFIPSAEIIWRKLEISGRKQGFGSRNSPSIRPNHEYIVVLRKGTNRIEGDFEYIGSAVNEMAISSWDEKPIEAWSEREKTLFTSDIWEIGAARSKEHPATFSQQLADWLVRLFSPLGSVVLDPWNGSGTTSVVAALNRRHFIGIDIEPYFCEVATKRVAAAIAKLPELATQAAERLRHKAA